MDVSLTSFERFADNTNVLDECGILVKTPSFWCIQSGFGFYTSNNPIFGDRLMAGLMFLVHPIGVRIPVPENKNATTSRIFIYILCTNPSNRRSAHSSRHLTRFTRICKAVAFHITRSVRSSESLSPRIKMRPQVVFLFTFCAQTPPIGVALILRAISLASLGYAKLSLFISLVPFARPNPCPREKQPSS